MVTWLSSVVGTLRYPLPARSAASERFAAAPSCTLHCGTPVAAVAPSKKMKRTASKPWVSMIELDCGVVTPAAMAFITRTTLVELERFTARSLAMRGEALREERDQFREGDRGPMAEEPTVGPEFGYACSVTRANASPRTGMPSVSLRPMKPPWLVSA